MATLRFLVSHVCRWFHETFFLASWQIDQKLAKLNRCQVLTVPMIQSVPQDYMNNVGWQALKNQLFKEDQAAKNLVKWWENESASTIYLFPFSIQKSNLEIDTKTSVWPLLHIKVCSQPPISWILDKVPSIHVFKASWRLLRRLRST